MKRGRKEEEECLGKPSEINSLLRPGWTGWQSEKKMNWTHIKRDRASLSVLLLR